MRKSTIAASLFTICGLVGLSPSLAVSEPQGAVKINDQDSIYIDGRTFQVTPGESKGGTLNAIKSLGAHELGPAAIIIRFGDKLYIADAHPKMAAANRSYAYDPRTINPALSGGGSSGYNQHVATDFAYDPRAVNPALSGGGSAGYNQHVATDFAYDPRGCSAVLVPGGSNLSTEYAYDPRGYYRPNLIGGGSPGYNQHVVTDYAYDPRDYNPSLIGAGSVGYNHQAATDYAYDPQTYPIRDPNPWANNYAFDPGPMIVPSIIYDPRYLEFRLKAAFEENWTPSAASSGSSH